MFVGWDHLSSPARWNKWEKNNLKGPDMIFSSVLSTNKLPFINPEIWEVYPFQSLSSREWREHCFKWHLLHGRRTWHTTCLQFNQLMLRSNINKSFWWIIPPTFCIVYFTRLLSLARDEKLWSKFEVWSWIITPSNYSYHKPQLL